MFYESTQHKYSGLLILQTTVQNSILNRNKLRFFILSRVLLNSRCTLNCKNAYFEGKKNLFRRKYILLYLRSNNKLNESWLWTWGSVQLFYPNGDKQLLSYLLLLVSLFVPRKFEILIYTHLEKKKSWSN